MHDGDLVVTCRMPSVVTSLRMVSVRRGQVVVFRNQWSGALAIKRVIGIAGDRVQIESGTVLLNGLPIEDVASVRRADDSWAPSRGSATVPRGYLFVLSDNRLFGIDSRVAGYVAVRDVIGIVLGVMHIGDQAGAAQRNSVQTRNLGAQTV